MSLPEISTLELQRALSGSSPVAAVKNLLSDFTQASYDHFLRSKDAQGLITQRAEQMDKVIGALWQNLELDDPRLALIAVGGYGRGELHPHSDIDVLLLADNESAINDNSEALQTFITWLWDLKLEIGHSVRTLEECVQKANEDLTIITNLMESRLLKGNQALFSRLKARVTTEHMWTAEAFFHAKWEEIKQRHQKHNESEYNLEPNVKNSPGTLRDLQTVSWVSARYFGDCQLEHLIKRGFITPDEAATIIRQKIFFSTLRFVLHMLSQREEDRITFELQDRTAEILGYEDDDNGPRVEQFMKDFYRHQIATTELCDLLLLHFNEDFLQTGGLTSVESVHEHFLLQNGYLLALDDGLYQTEPQWLLKTFWLMAQLPQAVGMHSQTVRAIRANRHLIDDEFRHNPVYNAIFMDIIKSEQCVVRELSRMTRYGILGRYLPAFGKVIGMMEHDLLNIHTVHDHSLRTMRWLRYLRFGQQKDTFPIASRLIHRIHKPEVLYLAAFLHDLGKGEAGNCIQNSADIAKDFCRQHNLRPTETGMIVWLVEHQMLMQEGVQRIDLHDPEQIHQFATLINDRRKLDLLYLLSVADLINTNAALWSTWQATQMRSLYEQTLSALRRGLEHPLDAQTMVQEIKDEAFPILLEKGLTPAEIERHWGAPGDEYFLREGVDSLVWQTLEIAKHRSSEHVGEPLIAFRNPSRADITGATLIFIFTKDSPNIFSAVASTLDRFNLNILDARVMTSQEEKNVVDTFMVLDDEQKPITDPDRLENIRNALIENIKSCDHLSTLSQRRPNRALQHFNIEPEVTLSTDTSSPYSILDITAADQPGLLALISRVLCQYDLVIQSAKIFTAGERVSDIFYISNQDGTALSDQDQCQQLIDVLLKALKNNSSE